MKKLVMPALAAGLVLTAASPMLSEPAAAQVVKGVGVVSLPAVIANSNAFKVAEEQRTVTYKPQIDQANARRQAIAAQLQPMYQKLQTDQQNSVAQAQLQQQAVAIQQIEQAGQRELQQVVAPIAMSRAYVQEQIEDRLDEAVQAAAKNRNVTLILDAAGGNVIFAEATYNINQAVLDELNRLLPSAQLVPPAGWVPREVRQQQEQAAAAQAAQGQQQPTPQTNGR